METGSYLSIITLNINGLNASAKRQRLVEQTQKQNPYKRHTSNLEAQSGSEGLEKDIHVNGDQKIMGEAILISDKI